MSKIVIVHNEKIVIAALDNIVTAKKYVGKTAVAAGVARCSPDDRFNFDTGAKLAFERMLKNDENKPEYYTGRIVCIKNNLANGMYTKGKIYDVVDGVLVRDDHFRVEGILSFEDFNKKSIATWLEIKE